MQQVYFVFLNNLKSLALYKLSAESFLTLKEPKWQITNFNLSMSVKFQYNVLFKPYRKENSTNRG